MDKFEVQLLRNVVHRILLIDGQTYLLIEAVNTYSQDLGNLFNLSLIYCQYNEVLWKNCNHGKPNPVQHNIMKFYGRIVTMASQTQFSTI